MYLLALFFLVYGTGSVLSYKAAVVEYYPEVSDTPQNTVKKNLDRYRSFTDTARAQAVDIIVFPEYGLTTIVQDPEEYSVQLFDDHIIKELSAIAQEHQIYLVVNLLEKVLIGTQRKYHNTNLVFDRNGTVLTVYRKINLYKENKLTPGSSTQNATFETDFGVTFGIFTCADILYNNPSRKIFENKNVTDVVYPAAWISTMPFLTSLSVQHGYALANGVNLLAANYGTPKEGHGGSGIYLADGKIAETYIADSASSKPIVRDVTKRAAREDTTLCPSVTQFGLPTDSTKSNVSDFFTAKALNVSGSNFESVDLTRNESSITVCGKESDFCCTFDISINTTQVSPDIYKVLAFDGEVDLDQTKVHIRTCGLVACENNADESCGARVNASTKFKKLTVKGNLPKDETAFYSPVTLNSFLLPSAKLSTTGLHQNVLVFGLYGKTDVPVKPRTTDDWNQNDDSGGNSAASVFDNGFRFLLLLVLTKVLFA